MDTGSHMVRHTLKLTKKEKGNILFGGLITPIAISLGYVLDDLSPMQGNTLIDLES
ncbi:hypothetical protein Dimus_029523, partial [Dionaea muscipula]